MSDPAAILPSMDRPYWHAAVMREVYELAALDGLAGSDVAVLAVLCAHADDSGVVELTRARLERLSCLGEATVRRVLRRLRDRGYVSHPFGPARTRRKLLALSRPTLLDALLLTADGVVDTSTGEVLPSA